MAQRSVERTLPWAVVRWQRPSPGQGHHPIDGKKKGHIAGDVSLSVEERTVCDEWHHPVGCSGKCLYVERGPRAPEAV